uniref:Uncharacterized protein AlNc14C9G1157 n=1 Tax=Albugo laibachii Nc14 TaxID=890382 RepID=F0W2A7_9STRA|nr:conserved hypothetical protein [Albugo laibachii Nc14]|eukprot:CCA15192.1 conserved hypothetical protein [Albugo laibachii Nc14]
MGTFLQERVTKPLMKVLKSGASPQSIALALAFGVTGGVFPLPGITSVPVMLATIIFRLNPVAAMLTNYLATPINVASFPLFIYYGNSIFGNEHTEKGFSISQFTQDLKTDPLSTLLLFRFTLLNAIYLWMLCVPVMTLILYLVLTPIVRRLIPSSKKHT